MNKNTPLADKPKRWRPDNWETIKEKTRAMVDGGDTYSILEAGADIMLGSIRAEIMMKLIQYEWGDMTGHDVLVWLREFF